MRALHVFLFFALLPALVLSSQPTADKTSYAKGDVMHISGGAQPGELVELYIANGPRVLYRDKIIASSSGFSADYPISSLDPKGTWRITISSKAGNSSLNAIVSPTREGAYYLVKFTSPPYESVEYARTDSVLFSVSVFDSKKPVSGARIRAWAGDKQFTLSEGSPGVYQGEHEIPFDSKIGSMEIYIVAEKIGEGNSSFGGEGSINIEVKEVPIQVEFISPTIAAYKVGDSIPVQVRATYSSGKPVVNPKVLAQANDLEFSLSKNGDFFSGEYKTRENDSGVLKLFVSVEDSAQNAGFASQNVDVKGFTTQAIADYYWYLIIGGAVLLALILFAAKTFLARSSLEKLENERGEILALEKGLQEDYIKNGTIDRETFEKRSAAYESRISELEAKISKMKKK